MPALFACICVATFVTRLTRRERMYFLLEKYTVYSYA